MNKGYFGTRHLLFRRANEAMLKSLWYAYRDRRVRKRDLRKLWIIRINAAARLNGMTYSRLVFGMKKAGIELNRKMLADLAVRDSVLFRQSLPKPKQPDLQRNPQREGEQSPSRFLFNGWYLAWHGATMKLRIQRQFRERGWDDRPEGGDGDERDRGLSQPAERAAG